VGSVAAGTVLADGTAGVCVGPWMDEVLAVLCTAPSWVVEEEAATAARAASRALIPLGSDTRSLVERARELGKEGDRCLEGLTGV
jgi:hypothetical protein